MVSPLTRHISFVLVALLALVGCRPSEPQTGPGLTAQSLDRVYFGPPAIPGVDGPLAQTQPDMPGEPWTLAPPIVVSTAELMARGSGVARDRASAPRLNKIRPDRTRLPDNPESRPLAQWPPSPFFRGGGPSAAFVAGTPNVNVGFIADTGFALPPDTMGDVGPTQYVVALNGRVRAISKATGAIDPAFDLDSDVFYGAAANGQPTGDPRVRYDRRVGRWYILMFNIAVPNRLLLAVSDTSIITGSTVWTITFWNNTRTQNGVGGAAGCLADYPTLGVDEDALYIGVNQFCGADINSQLTFDSVTAYVLPKSNLLAGSGVVVQFDGVVSNASAGPFTAHGIDNFDNGTNEGYFVGVDNASFSTLMLRRVSNPATTTPSLSGNVAITVPTTNNPVNVPQPGAVQPLDGIDDRLMNAVIRNGQLWTVHQIGVNSSGVAASGTGTRTAERWYQLGNLSGTPTVTQSGTVFDNAASNPVHHWMGSIMVNGQGHAALGASKGGSTTFVNTEFTGRLATATLSTMETPTQYSSNTSTLYNIQTTTVQRWGDYSYTSVDPNDDMTMWTLQEYPNASNSYAVRLIRLLAPPPAAIASLSPNSVATGQSSVNVTVTGTSSAGSGFFDPGPGFASRIAAAFSGSNVTVSSVAFNSPTSLTLTLNTVGASTGARTLTVTNPDGQQASLASALTITSGGGTPPVAVNDSYSTAFNTALNITAPGVLGNDNANGGGTMTASLISGPASGTLLFNGNGSFTYTPANGFTGPVTFTYEAANGNGTSNTATATITVNPPPPPTAANDSYNTPFNTTLNIVAPGVLGNDNANGGGTMTATLNSGPASGTLALNANGSFTYTPAAGFSGPATFTYRANTTAGGQSNLATVTVTVASGGTPPVFGIHPSDQKVYEGQSAAFSVNISGTPSPTCQWQSSSDLGGSWTSLTDGAVYSGTTTWFLRVANASLTMSGTQFRCLASNTAATVASNPATLSVALLVAGAAPANGAWTGRFTGGIDPIGFTVSGGKDLINVTYNTFLTCVGPVNYGPTIVPQSFSGDRFAVDGRFGCMATGSIQGVFTSPTTAAGVVSYSTTQLCACGQSIPVAWDASAGPTTPEAPQVLVQPTSQAIVAGQKARFTTAVSGRPFASVVWQFSTNGGGSWTNVPSAPPYSGETTPTLTILSSALAGLSGTQFRAVAQNASATVTSNPATLGTGGGGGSVPTSVADSYATSFQTTLTIAAPGVLGNDNSNGGGGMTAVLGSAPSSGTLALAADGGFTYTPNVGFSGTDSFTYRASNATGPGNLASVSVSVSAPPPGPVAPTSFRILAMAGNTITFAWALPTVGPTPTALQLEGGLTPGSVLGQLPLGLTPSATITLPTGSFFLRLRTIAAGAVSGPSNEILAHVNVPVTPSAPANLLGLVDGNTLGLAWTPTFGGGQPTGAMLDVSGAATLSLPLGPTESFSFAGVPPGSYTFAVRQTNGGGSSAPSSGVTLNFPGPCTAAPQMPTDFLAFKSGGLLTVLWAPPASGTAPTGYALNVSGSFVGSVPMAGRSLVVAPPPGTYTLSAVATNPCGVGPATAGQTLSFP